MKPAFPSCSPICDRLHLGISDELSVGGVERGQSQVENRLSRRDSPDLEAHGKNSWASSWSSVRQWGFVVMSSFVPPPRFEFSHGSVRQEALNCASRVRDAR